MKKQMAKPSLEVRNEMKGRLKALGLRSTGSRLAVLNLLHDQARPLSHAELMVTLATEGWDPATIYRILSDLTEAGMLRRMDLGDHVWRFELIDECRTIKDDHAHFLCMDCGIVTCLPEVELRATGGTPLPPALRGAELHLKVTGRCADCIG
ncbi:MAG: transcriptional repressor [Myxococcota bacterium]